MEGKVKWFSKEKGHGFIYVKNDSDHYFEVSDVIGPDLPCYGDTVGFDSSQNEKGKRANEVEILCKPLPIAAKVYDDRPACKSCGRHITPRQVFFSGIVTKSICPYCSARYYYDESTKITYVNVFNYVAYVMWFFIGLLLVSALLGA